MNITNLPNEMLASIAAQLPNRASVGAFKCSGKVYEGLFENALTVQTMMESRPAFVFFAGPFLKANSGFNNWAWEKLGLEESDSLKNMQDVYTLFDKAITALNKKDYASLVMDCKPILHLIQDIATKDEKDAITATPNDTAIVLAAVQSNGSALQFASPSLLNNQAIVLAATQQSGLAPKYVSAALRDDKSAALTLAVVKNPGDLDSISDSNQND